MEKKKKEQNIDNVNINESKTKLQQLEDEHQQNNNGLVNKAISEIQSLFSKKNYPINQNQSTENKNFSAEIQLDQNILNVTLLKNKKQNDNEPINKLLGKLFKENHLTELVTTSLDDKKLEKSQHEIKSNKMISLALDDDNPDKSYEIIAITDGNKKQNLILKN